MESTIPKESSGFPCGGGEAFVKGAVLWLLSSRKLLRFIVFILLAALHLQILNPLISWCNVLFMTHWAAFTDGLYIFHFTPKYLVDVRQKEDFTVPLMWCGSIHSKVFDKRVAGDKKKMNVQRTDCFEMSQRRLVQEIQVFISKTISSRMDDYACVKAPKFDRCFMGSWLKNGILSQKLISLEYLSKCKKIKGGCHWHFCTLFLMSGLAWRSLI